MFGLLAYAQDGQITLTYPVWNTLLGPAPVPFTNTQNQARLRQLNQTLASIYPDASAAAKKKAAFDVLVGALAYGPDEDVDYMIRMAVATISLYGAAYLTNAQQGIADMVHAQLVSSAQQSPTLARMVGRLKGLGFLLPEASRAHAIDYLLSEMRLKVPPAEVFDPWQSAAQTVIKKAEKGPQRQVGLRAILSARVAEVPTILTAVEKLLATPDKEEVCAKLWAVYENVRGTAKEMAPWFLTNAVFLVSNNPESADDIGAKLQAQAKFFADYCERYAYMSTVAAIDAGVDFGRHTQTNRDARNAALARLTEWETFQTAALVADARRSLMALATQAKPTQTQPEAAQQQGHLAEAVQSLTLSDEPDRDTLRTWSLDVLARWIEGPVPSKPLDRKAVVQRSKRSQPQKQTQSQPTPVKNPSQTEADAPTGEDTLTEDEVGFIANEGYRAAAKFLLDEIHDLAGIGKQLGVNSKVLDDCMNLVHDLGQLQNAPPTAAVADDKARLLLTHAETCIAQLRANIRTSQAIAQHKGRFGAAFQSALTNETLVLGRRQGGQIACPLKMEDWGWVVEGYHNRVLTGRRGLVVNGNLRQLGADEALVLYVTGSSQSDYAFDVTVHLWRRYPGKTSQAGRALPSVDNPLVPVNTDDWFDTYITCCVLHVPEAR